LRRAVSAQLLQVWVGDELLRRVARESSGEVRKKHVAGSGGRRKRGPRQLRSEVARQGRGRRGAE
jgi:hypothetical protein